MVRTCDVPKALVCESASQLSRQSASMLTAAAAVAA